MAFIKFITTEALDHLTSCIKDGNPQVIGLFEEPSNEKLLAYLKETFLGKECFFDTRHVLPDFNLDPSTKGKEEINNLKSVFTKLQGLTPAEASDKRFWVGLCILNNWPYVQQRWGITPGNSSNQSSIGDHFLYAHHLRRSHTRNAMARLWWIANLTYDNKNADDPFHLARFVLSDTDYVINLLERNFSNNHEMVREFVSAISKARGEGYKIGRLEIRQCCIYLNLLCGVYMFEAMENGSIFEKIYAKAKTFGK